MAFAVFDHDSLVSALQSVWSDIAPSAMFTAAANRILSTSEDFSTALDMLKWNQSVTDAALDETTADRAGFGFSYGSTASGDYTNDIGAQTANGSNNTPYDTDGDGFVDSWGADGDKIYVPAGFAPLRGENIVYADTLPPFDVTLTFASEYGHTAFQKIYDLDILNESSGVSVDTTIMSRQITWIARRLSPLIRGVYTRESSNGIRGVIKGVQPTDASN